ncbi:MAG TPA: hypothetical protein PKD00_09480, partial [Burkholderiales bacterium]|nr:hypothetical protein [Burkholderiales bacterium]
MAKITRDLQNYLDLAQETYQAKLLASQPSVDPFNARLASAPGVGTSTPSDVDIRQYEYSIPTSVGSEELPYYMASQQSDWQRLGRTAGNLLPNVMLGIAENFGYMYEFGDL